MKKTLIPQKNINSKNKNNYSNKTQLRKYENVRLCINFPNNNLHPKQIL